MVDRGVLGFLVLPMTLGCAQRVVPDPRPTLAAYARAASAGDAKEVFGLLSERSRKELRLADVERIVKDERAELTLQSRALSSPQAKVRAEAVVRYADGESAVLQLDDGEFKVCSGGVLPARPSSPEQALEQFRSALARRSYVALLRVLSPATRQAIESDLRTLVLGLERPEALEIQLVGETAVVRLEGGRTIKLKKDRGVWYVEDWD